VGMILSYACSKIVPPTMVSLMPKAALLSAISLAE